MDNAQALKQVNGNHEALVRLSNEAKKELCRWITNTVSSLQYIMCLTQTLLFILIQGH